MGDASLGPRRAIFADHILICARAGRPQQAAQLDQCLHTRLRLGDCTHSRTIRGIEHPSWDFEAIAVVAFVDLTPEESPSLSANLAANDYVLVIEWVPWVMHPADLVFGGSVTRPCITSAARTYPSTRMRPYRARSSPPTAAT